MASPLPLRPHDSVLLVAEPESIVLLLTGSLDSCSNATAAGSLEGHLAGLAGQAATGSPLASITPVANSRQLLHPQLLAFIHAAVPTLTLAELADVLHAPLPDIFGMAQQLCDWSLAGKLKRLGSQSFYEATYQLSNASMTSPGNVVSGHGVHQGLHRSTNQSNTARGNVVGKEAKILGNVQNDIFLARNFAAVFPVVEAHLSDWNAGTGGAVNDSLGATAQPQGQKGYQNVPAKYMASLSMMSSSTGRVGRASQAGTQTRTKRADGRSTPSGRTSTPPPAPSESLDLIRCRVLHCVLCLFNGSRSMENVVKLLPTALQPHAIDMTIWLLRQSLLAEVDVYFLALADSESDTKQHVADPVPVGIHTPLDGSPTSGMGGHSSSARSTPTRSSISESLPESPTPSSASQGRGQGKSPSRASSLSPSAHTTLAATSAGGAGEFGREAASTVRKRGDGSSNGNNHELDTESAASGSSLSHSYPSCTLSLAQSMREKGYTDGRHELGDVCWREGWDPAALLAEIETCTDILPLFVAKS
jgi:hypothetical protein